MNGEWLPALRDEDDDLEEIPRSVRPDEQPAIGVVAGVFDDQCMINGMDDLLVGNAVPAGGRQHLHPIIVVRKGGQSTQSDAERFLRAWAARGRCTRTGNAGWLLPLVVPCDGRHYRMGYRQLPTATGRGPTMATNR